MHQTLSVHITLDEFENVTISGHFRFVSEENSDRKISSLRSSRFLSFSKRSRTFDVRAD